MNGWVRRIGTSGSGEWYREAEPLESGKPRPATEILLVRKDQPTKSTGPTKDTLEPQPGSLSPAVQTQHSKAYKELHKRITDAGLYQCPYLAGYGPEFARYSLLGALSILAYSKGWFLSSAVFLGLLWHQLAFIAHDLGHNGVTHIWLVDRLVGIFIASFIGGLSIGWWADNHNIHHLVTNHPSHDPDIQHIPFFAISPVFLSSLWSSYYKRIMTFDVPSKLLISMQHHLYYIVMSLARFNLYANSYGFLAKRFSHPKKGKLWWLEVGGIVFFWTWLIRVLVGVHRQTGSWGMAVEYILVSHIVASPLHVQIVLSHFARSTDDLGPYESFPHRQLRTTTDVICPPHLAFVHGGLHLQVTHHLFPRLPRHNLRAASLMVKEFAKEQGLEYAEFGFIEGNGEVRSVLKDVARQAALIGKVVNAEIEERIKTN
jgi:delta8-fatty-acid desaturase